MNKRYWAILIVVLMFSLAPTAASSPSVVASVLLQGDNRLQNGDFEGGFSQREAPEIVVANGWEPWWQEGTEEEQQQGYLRRPEYKPDSSRASGSQQKFFNSYATHNAGIYQRVPVAEGSQLALTARVYVWSSSQDDFNRSEGPGAYDVMVGIDPTGGTDALVGTVAWSPAQRTYDQWIDLSMNATAQADAVTVFLRGTVEYRVKHNNSYWDDVVVTVLGETNRVHLPLVLKTH